MQTIPLKVISLLAELLPKYETHASLNSIFLYADIENTFPELSKPNRVQETLIHINKANPNPLKILGKVLEKYSVHDKFHRTLILSGFCLLKIAKISLNSSFFPKPIKR